MARKTRKTKQENKIETQNKNIETKQDLTQPEILEIKDKIDLSDTSINVEEVKDKILIEEKQKENKKQEKSEKIKENKKKIEKKENKKVNPLKETEATVLPPFDIDEDFFTGERKRKIDIKKIHNTYAIDQLL